MKINRVDLGYNPLRAPVYQQMLGDVVVEHGTTISYERGSGPRELAVIVWVSAQTTIAGFAAGSQGANEALCRWLEELATNPDLNDPVLVNWSSLRALPQDGWWHLVNCSPNYQWTGAGRIPVSMTFRQRGALNAPVSTFWGGGALPSVYTAVPRNLVGLPQNAVGIVSAVRSGGEGGYSFVLDPPSAAGGTQGIIQYLQSANLDDWVKSGAHVYDAMAAIGTNPVPGSGFLNANWLEVLGVEHSFVGDLVFTNGLLLVTISLNGSVQLYAWTRAGAWLQVGAIQSVDPSGNVGVPLTVDVWKVGYEEIALDVTYVGAANSATVSMRLQRGHRLLRLGPTPKSFDNNGASLIRFVPSTGGSMIVYNEATIADQQGGASSLAPTSVYPFGAGYLRAAGWPFVVSLHYQAPTGAIPAQQPGFGAGGAGLNLGDTSGPSQFGTRLYAIGVTPFTNPQNLAGAGGAASLTGGWAANNDSANGGYGTNQAKLPSGTAIVAKAQNIAGGGSTVVLPAGLYRVWHRMRAGSAGAPGGTANYGVFNQTGAAYLLQIAVPVLTTAYVWYSAGTFTADGTSAYNLFVELNAGTTLRDWFVDEAAFVPMTQTQFADGPQELCQQSLFERTTRFPVV